MPDVWIMEVEQGAISIEQTPILTYRIIAIINGQTVQFEASMAGLWAFPRKERETQDEHFKRYILHRLAEEQQIQLPPTPAPPPPVA